jgi:hypothetical protein
MNLITALLVTSSAAHRNQYPDSLSSSSHQSLTCLLSPTANTYNFLPVGSLSVYRRGIQEVPIMMGLEDLKSQVLCPLETCYILSPLHLRYVAYYLSDAPTRTELQLSTLVICSEDIPLLTLVTNYTFVFYNTGLILKQGNTQLLSFPCRQVLWYYKVLWKGSIADMSDPGHITSGFTSVMNTWPMPTANTWNSPSKGFLWIQEPMVIARSCTQECPSNNDWVALTCVLHWFPVELCTMEQYPWCWLVAHSAIPKLTSPLLCVLGLTSKLLKCFPQGL